MLVLGWHLLLAAICVLGAEAWLAAGGGPAEPLTAFDAFDLVGQSYVIDLLRYHLALPASLFDRPLTELLVVSGVPLAAIGHFFMKLRLVR